MSDTAEYIIHEGHGIDIVAIVEFDIIPASGDGWNEPHEPASVDFAVTKLVKITHTYERVGNTGKLSDYQRVSRRTDLGEAPAWVRDIIAADEDWQNDLLANDLANDLADALDAADRAYDERRDLELTDRQS
jgi:hypothetical protein